MSRFIRYCITVFALAAAPAFGQSADESAIAKQMDALHKAIVAVDKGQLERLTWPELNYGHSSGRIENQAQFVEALVSKKSILSKIDLSKMTTSIVGDLAIVRCNVSAIVESTGKPVPTELGQLTIWQKRGGDWKLLARQSWRI